MIYFNHRSFKDFFKRVRGLGFIVYIYYEVGNSLNLPEYIIDKKIILKSLKHEFWETNGIHHYIINDFFSFDIPVHAERISGEDMFGYIWREGPTNYFVISRKHIVGTMEDNIYFEEKKFEYDPIEDYMDSTESI